MQKSKERERERERERGKVSLNLSVLHKIVYLKLHEQFRFFFSHFAALFVSTSAEWRERVSSRTSGEEAKGQDFKVLFFPRYGAARAPDHRPLGVETKSRNLIHYCALRRSPPTKCLRLTWPQMPFRQIEARKRWMQASLASTLITRALFIELSKSV